MNIKKLSINPIEVRLNASKATVKIYAINTFYPYIKYNGNFKIVEDNSFLCISQMNNEECKKKCDITLSSNKIITKEGCKIIQRGNSIITTGNGINVSQINGKVFINGSEECFEEYSNYDFEEGLIEIVLPKDNQCSVLDINLLNGQVDLKNLILSRLIIKIDKGDINLNNFDSLDTMIRLINGNFEAEIMESRINYVLNINSLMGDVEQINDYDNNKANILNQKHVLDIENVKGDIKVLFKGKRV